MDRYIHISKLGIYIVIHLGAWWIGFLVCAVAALINAFPILMFARE